MIRSDTINGHIIQLAHQKKLPVFMLEREYDGCVNMAFSYRDGFEKVARHIVEDHGCGDVVMVAGIRGNSFSEERIAMCRQILEEHGKSLPPEKVIYGEYWDEPTYRALDAYFASGARVPEAFLCANDAMAIAVCIYLSERNIRVPEQVRVAGFDGILPGESHVPAITTARPDFAYMFGKMLDRINAWRPEETGGTEVWPIPFEFIRRVCDACVTKPHESKEHIRSQKIDNVLTGKFTALPVFIAIMALVFFLTFEVVGAWLQELLGRGIGWLTEVVDGALTAGNVNPAIHDLIVKGIFEGVGSVLSFLPIIVTMFFFLSILEDSGYIARVAFFMDKLLRRIGLSGRSIVPMLIGFGCTVPAVMSTRTLPSERDRKMTILLTPFMSCTAKLPIYGFFVDAFFPNQGWLVMTLLYLLGIVTAILVALLFKSTLFKGEAVPFVMELPNYRMPSPRSVLQLFLKSFDFQFNMVSEAEESRSILAGIAGFLVPLFQPVGLGDWRIVTSFISGFMAKESVVSVLQMFFGTANSVTQLISSGTAVVILVFSLLYTPCVAAVASIKRELGGKWAVGLIAWQCLIAWVAALLARLACMMFGLG